MQSGERAMRASWRIGVWAGGLIFCCAISGFGYASTMGSLWPQNVSSSPGKQQNQQWVSDPRTKCIVAAPDLASDGGVSWQGRCRNGMADGPGSLALLNRGQVVETIVGTFSDGLLQPGRVTATWSDGAKYEGDQLGGLFNGAGK